MTRHEPGGFVGNLEHARHLANGNALLAAAKQMIEIEPAVQWDFGAFKDRAYGHRERPAASIAPIDPGAGGLALQARRLPDAAAMGADRALRPRQALQMVAGGV